MYEQNLRCANQVKIVRVRELMIENLMKNDGISETER